MDIIKYLCCCCFTPDEWRWYGKQKPWFEPFDKCKKRIKKSVFQDLLRIPGTTENTIKSLLLSEIPRKKCKCDAWNKDNLFSIPFSTDASEAWKDMRESLLLKQLMKRLGFHDNDEDITKAEKRMFQRWLKDLNRNYNLQNGNAACKRKQGKRRIEGSLNYLDYSLFKYAPDEHEYEESTDKSRERTIKKPINLPKDVCDDLRLMKRRLHRSFTKKPKQLKTMLFYQPLEKDNDGLWKSFNPRLGAEGLKNKLSSLGYFLDFNDWTTRALNYIIKGEIVPAELYDYNSIKDLQNTLTKLMERKREPKYDFYGFEIPAKKRRRSSNKRKSLNIV